MGNVRLSYTDTNGNNAIVASEVIEESNYYPFGLQHKGYNNIVIIQNGNSTAQKFKYNEKEYNESFGMNIYEYGARNYMPDLGRFFNIDRMTEMYENFSPYNYGANNPVYFIDVNGDFIYIKDPSSDKTFRYHNGEVQHKVSGEWETIDAAVNLPRFVLGIVAGIQALEMLKTGCDMVTYFSKGGNDITFDYGRGMQEYSGSTKTITIDHEPTAQTFVKIKGGAIELQPSPLFINIGHEMAHAMDPEQVSFNNTWYKMKNNEIVTKSEIYATHYENMLRAEAGLPLRSHYGGIFDPATRLTTPDGQSRIIDMDGNSVYFGHPNPSQFRMPSATIKDGLRAENKDILKNRFNYYDGN